jgi:hypothetical protein
MAVGLQDPWLAKRMGLSADSACARARVKIARLLLLFLTELVKSWIGAQRVPNRIEL